jgi:hypothetical protein
VHPSQMDRIQDAPNPRPSTPIRAVRDAIHRPIRGSPSRWTGISANDVDNSNGVYVSLQMAARPGHRSAHDWRASLSKHDHTQPRRSLERAHNREIYMLLFSVSRLDTVPVWSASPHVPLPQATPHAQLSLHTTCTPHLPTQGQACPQRHGPGIPSPWLAPRPTLPTSPPVAPISTWR